MSLLWVEDETRAGAETWSAVPLAGQDLLPLSSPPGSGDGAALLFRSASDDGGRWILMAVSAAGVRLNGEPLHTGLRVLRDRDEIHVAGGGRMYFSTEALAELRPFPGSEAPTYCPRCRQEVHAAQPAVSCPGCGRWYHQDDATDLPCFTYATRCALCPQATALDAGYQWTPEQL